MAPFLNKPDYTQEGRMDWTWVGENATSEGREPQLQDCNVALAQETNTAAHEPSGLTMVNQLERRLRNVHLGPGEVEGGPFQVHNPDSDESMANTSTPSTCGNNDQHSPSPIQGISPQPKQLTFATVDACNVPRMTYDFQAWVNGDPGCWCVPDGQDCAGAPGPERGTTHRSSHDSLAYVFVPVQPCDVGRDVVGMGAEFDDTLPFDDQLEIE